MMTTRSMTVARTADIKPGELAAFDVEGVRVAVANANGRFFAIDDTCTHEQCSLTEEGTLDGTVVTCGCHGAQFDVPTGQVMAPPAFEPVKAYPLLTSTCSTPGFTTSGIRWSSAAGSVTADSWRSI